METSDHSKHTSLAKLLDGSRMLLAGGLAGATARTATAPLDRIKLLFQVQAIASAGTSATAYTSISQAAGKILREEGFAAFWKGNGVNIIRVFPYSAFQLMSFDSYKRLFANHEGKLTLAERLSCGALAGMTATTLTHPLDIIRLRLALPNHPYSGAVNAAATIVRSEGALALMKGLGPTLIGIAPYAAINFASYDSLKKWFYHGNRPQSPASNLLLGAASGIIAASTCYPLDTIRRRMQMKGKAYNGQLDAFHTIFRTEGLRGFYRGWAANSLKVVPQNAIRLVSYEAIKKVMGVKRATTDT